jgi:hypothetical protein
MSAKWKSFAPALVRASPSDVRSKRCLSISLSRSRSERKIPPCGSGARRCAGDAALARHFEERRDVAGPGSAFATDHIPPAFHDLLNLGFCITFEPNILIAENEQLGLKAHSSSALVAHRHPCEYSGGVRLLAGVFAAGAHSTPCGSIQSELAAQRVNSGPRLPRRHP